MKNQMYLLGKSLHQIPESMESVPEEVQTASQGSLGSIDILLFIMSFVLIVLTIILIMVVIRQGSFHEQLQCIKNSIRRIEERVRESENKNLDTDVVSETQTASVQKSSAGKRNEPKASSEAEPHDMSAGPNPCSNYRSQSSLNYGTEQDFRNDLAALGTRALSYANPVESFLEEPKPVKGLKIDKASHYGNNVIFDETEVEDARFVLYSDNSIRPNIAMDVYNNPSYYTVHNFDKIYEFETRAKYPISMNQMFKCVKVKKYAEAEKTQQEYRLKTKGIIVAEEKP